MLEQDLELVKLLHEQCIALASRQSELDERLSAARAQLSGIEKAHNERAAFAGTLAATAELLKRDDLRVELPDASALSAEVAELEAQLAGLNDESGKYQALFAELKANAPGLLAAAGLAPADTAAAGHEDTDSDPIVDFSPEEEAVDAALTGYGHEALKRFNLQTIIRRAEQVHGRGAVYLLDALSVLSRVPAYDYELRGLALDEARDELIADLDMLGSEVPGTFCVVFDEPYEPGVSFGMEIQIEFPAQGGKDAANERLEALADDYSGKLRTVCVVTGDSELGERLREKGMHLMTLGEFFSA